MSRPSRSLTRVAVTMRRSDATGYLEPRDALARDWTPLFERYHLCPVLLPSAATEPVAWARELGCQGLLLTGGESLGADPERDVSEGHLLDWALAENLPIAGVCRGMQAIQRFFGGGVEDVDDREVHVASEHELVLEPDFATLLGAHHQVRVNSFHGQRIAGPAAGFSVQARTSDGTPEVIEHRSSPMRAVQFHPERPGCDPRLSAWLFAGFTAAPPRGASPAGQPARALP